MLGYLMADDTEQFHSSEHTIALWAQKLRGVEMLMIKAIHLTSPWILRGATMDSDPATAASPTVSTGEYFPGFSFAAANASAYTLATKGDGAVMPFTQAEILAAKGIYWILFPLAQYILAMILADTFQYFTHRAFHVNKWLYSKPPIPHHHVFPAPLNLWLHRLSSTFD